MKVGSLVTVTEDFYAVPGIGSVGVIIRIKGDIVKIDFKHINYKFYYNDTRIFDCYKQHLSSCRYYPEILRIMWGIHD